MWLPSRSPSYLKNNGCPVKSPLTGKREPLLPFLRRGEAGEPHLCAWEDMEQILLEAVFRHKR